MSKLVPIDNIEEGMVLTSPQVNRYGQVLLAKGTSLTMDHLKLLKTWGIERISVEDDSSSEELSEAYLERREETERRMKLRMLWEPSNIYEVDMYRTAINSKLEA